MKHMKYGYLLLFFLMLFACARVSRQSDDLALLQQAKELTFIDPDSMRAVLFKITDPALLSAGDRAEYDLLYARAHLYADTIFTDEVLFAHAFGYYREQGDTSSLFSVYETAATYWAYQDDVPKAQKYMDEAMEIARQQADSVRMVRLYAIKAEIYRSEDRWREYIQYMDSALAITPDYSPYIYYEIGLAYAFLAESDTGNEYIEKSITLSLEEGDTLSAVHYLRNLANIYYEGRNYAEAIRWNREIGGLGAQWIPPQTYTGLSLGYLAMGKPDSAAFYLKQAQQYDLGEETGGNAYRFITHKNTMFLIENLLHQQQGEHISIFDLGHYNDAVREELESHVKVIEHQVVTRKNLELQNLQLKVKQKNILLWSLAGGAFLLIGGLCLYWRYLSRVRQMVEIEEKAEALQALLDNALKEEGGSETNSTFFKRVLLQQLGMIRLMATNPTTQNQELLQQISRISNEDVDVDTLLVWDDLYQTIDKVYDNFHRRVKEKYNEILSEKEIQLCCLLRADFSTKEISVVTQQSLRTIYQRKTTIRGRLDMDEKEDIVSFLNGI